MVCDFLTERIHSRSGSTGVAIACQSLSSPPLVFHLLPPCPISICSVGSPPLVSGALGCVHNTVSVWPAALVVTQSPVGELFHP